MVSIPKAIKIVRTSKAYTFEMYLQREEVSTEKHEFYNGKIIQMPDGSHTHSELAMNIRSAIKMVIRPLPRKYRLYSSDLKIHIESAATSVYPDAIVICETPEFWGNRTDVIVNPLVVIEILSPKTQAYDRLGKFELYKLLPSFQEYVLVNADTPAVETRFREEDDLWRIRTVTDLQQKVSLRALGVEISMADIYEDIIFPIKKSSTKK
jgi:Uma2 family endonuclease